MSLEEKLNKLLQLIRDNDFSDALALGRSLRDDHPDDLNVQQLFGSLLASMGRFAEAEPLLERALERLPHNENVLFNLGLVKKNTEKYAVAAELFERTLQLNPRRADVLFSLGSIAELQGELGESENRYRQALQLLPGYVEPMASLSYLLATRDRAEEAKQLAEQALSIRPDHPVANLALAALDARNQDHQAVIERMNRILEPGTLSAGNFALAKTRLAKAYEASGEFAEAFAHFRHRNDELYGVYAPVFEQVDTVYSPESVQRLQRFFASSDLPKAQPHISSSNTTNDGAELVFLLGFPRSGTTLLDQVLSSHPDVFVMEEKENFATIYNSFYHTEEALAGLLTLSSELREQQRQAYLNTIEKHVQGNNKIVIDKLPLNTIMLGLIGELFPKARVILALRDPRDVCLSCFQQSFDINQAMFQFLKLPTAVSYYDAVMTLGLQLLERYPLPSHAVKYEAVIDDFEATVQELLEFLGLDWDENVHDFQSTAQARTINTPSAEQVVKPLYQSSIGKWRRYQQWIETDLEPLSKWLKVWGYDDNRADSA